MTAQPLSCGLQFIRGAACVARLFISHSSANNVAAVALQKWLSEHGFDDVFLDIDPKRGLVAGDRWQEALKAAADRCEVVLFLISPDWLASKWCLAEFLLAKTLHKRIFGIIVEPVPLAQIPSEMTSESQLCELVGEDSFRTFDVDFGQSQEQVSFRVAGLDQIRRGLERAGLNALSFRWPPPADPQRAPYRGLRALEAQDAAIFFGRDAAIVRGLDRIRGLAESGIEKLFVVLGASGSGKSSFLRAGLLPRLARDDAMFLPLPPVRPESAAVTGPAGLAASLAGGFERLGEQRSVGRIKSALANGEFGRLLDELSALAKRRLVGTDAGKAEATIVLPLDQAEELFNPEGAEESARFLDLMSEALEPGDPAAGRRLIVVATIRSDRYDLLQREKRWLSIKHEPFNLPPIAQAEFKSVIEGPARRVTEAGGKLVIDPALTERLIADAQGADSLPLLGFTLERLYTDFGRDGRLTLAEYESVGGMQGSIEAAVAQALVDPGRAPAIPADKAAQHEALRAAFIPWLARINPETGLPMRRVAQRDEIPQASRAMVERLVEVRLLLADRHEGVDTVEVAHESLLRQWPALASWLEADAANLKALEGVDRAASEWARNGRLDSWLDHRGERLTAADVLATRDDFRMRLGATGAAYLAACRAREAAERQQQEAALAREQDRLAQIAAAQTRTAHLQRRATWTLAAVVGIVALAIGVVWWQYEINVAQRRANEVARINLLNELATVERLRGNTLVGLRLAVHGARLATGAEQTAVARAGLAASIWLANWQLMLSGHDLDVRSASFSRDGAHVLTASQDGSARIWDARTGKSLAVLTGHDLGLYSAAYNAAGDRIVTASRDKTARVWDLATGKELAKMSGHQGVVYSAAFSRDGKRVVTSSPDGTARIWEAETGSELLVLRGHKGEVNSAAFSPDGARVVTASDDRTVRIWDAATGQLIDTLQGHSNITVRAYYSPDGTRIVTTSVDQTARIWDAATHRELAVLRGHDGIVWAAAFSPDGKHLVTGSSDRTVRVWDVAGAHEISPPRGHDNDVRGVAFSPDGAHIVSASQDRTARIWSLDDSEIAPMGGHEGDVNSVAFSPDGRRLVSGSEDHVALIRDAATGREIMALRGHDDAVSSTAFSADGTRVVTGSKDRTARIWDAATGKQLAIMRGHQDAVHFAAFSRDGKRVVTGSKDRTARIWDAATGNELAVLRGHSDDVSAATFSPDGARILTASLERTARIWDASTGKQIAVLNGHDSFVYSAAFSPDGTRIVTGSHDRTARIWDAATGRELVTLRGHTASITSAAFSPDGSRVVTGAEDRTIRIWDAATGKDIAVLRGHLDFVRSVSYSPDGTRIVSGSNDDTARLWEVRLLNASMSDLINEACLRRLARLSIMPRSEMRTAGYPDDMPQIDVCAGIEGRELPPRDVPVGSVTPAPPK
jgi:WD40 repeat protein